MMSTLMPLPHAISMPILMPRRNAYFHSPLGWVWGRAWWLVMEMRTWRRFRGVDMEISMGVRMGLFGRGMGIGIVIGMEMSIETGIGFVMGAGQWT